ncbi:MAG TPA: ROK family protein [Terriglobales bacterium]|nr:ROK family protein [Terriglobales bacterium]
MTAFAIGVDLGGTNLRIAAVDEAGRLMEKMTLGAEVGRGRERVIEDMTAAIREVVQRFNSDRLLGIGIGVPGIIDIETGTVHQSPNLPDWRDYPVRDEIEKRLNTRVILENDANAAALGEQWLGAARDHDDMCMLTLGTGVGGGIVLGGRVWHGFKGMAGELGHITVEPEGPPCGCGSRGCVEQLASATAVVRMAKEAIAAGQAPGLARAHGENPEFDSKIVYQMAVQGERAAQEIYRKVGWALGIVVADLVNIFNLPMYVIGGGMASAWEAFAPTLLQEARARSYIYAETAAGDDAEPGRKKTIITRALLSGDAGLFGAARLPMLPDEVQGHAKARLRTA